VVNINSGYNYRNINKIYKFIKKLNIYIVRVNNKDELKSSAPCVYCFKIIKLLNFNKIIYSENDNTFVESKTELYNTIHMSVGYKYMQYLKYAKYGETFVTFNKKSNY
jgi:hypothetical protein